MAKLEISTVIHRPVEEVFAVVSNFENNPKWNSSSIEVKKTSAGPIGQGTTWRSVVNLLGQRVESESEVSEYEPNRKITTKGKQGPIPTKSQVTFESVNGGTRVSAILEGEPGSFFKLAEPLLVNLAKRQFDAALANLKDLMEAHAL
jgi:uncharacterized membrane protein